jgi:hypothetical protein
MIPIYRQMFRAQSQPGQADACADGFAALQPELQQRIERGQLLTASVFRWGEQFFFYTECIAIPLEAEDLYGPAADMLLVWPGGEDGRRFIPLMDIFHCVEPQGLDHWRRKTAPERIFAKVARLKPEMISSYIFYHYQLQEERPGNFDKYCLIGIHENLLFFYLEHPFVVEPPPAPGKLSTKHTPDHWQDVMDPHFDLWADAPAGQAIWRDIETIFTLTPAQ